MSYEEVGSVGGIIGTSVSASFLFLIACINTFFLIQAIRFRRRAVARARLPAQDNCRPAHDSPAEDAFRVQGGGCLVRIVMPLLKAVDKPWKIVMPLLKAVDKPWKMYPVGILFGFGESSSLPILETERTNRHVKGFDTASSIALLAISAVAQQGPNGKSISHGEIVFFPVSLLNLISGPNAPLIPGRSSCSRVG